MAGKKNGLNGPENNEPGKHERIWIKLDQLLAKARVGGGGGGGKNWVEQISSFYKVSFRESKEREFLRVLPTASRLDWWMNRSSCCWFRRKKACLPCLPGWQMFRKWIRSALFHLFLNAWRFADPLKQQPGMKIENFNQTSVTSSTKHAHAYKTLLFFCPSFPNRTVDTTLTAQAE